MSKQVEGWDTAYEWKAVALLGLGFGLVGLDRWVLAPLFPAMMADLDLDYQDLGNLVGVLALSWGVFAILMGSLSDRVGRRRILIPAIVLFSVLSAFTGLAASLAGLLLIRGLMGASEGAYLATSVAATGEASHPKRRGFNQGLQMCSFSLFGLGLGPIIATQLLELVPSWRQVFMIVALPGLVVAYFLWRVIREPVHLDRRAVAASAPAAGAARWRDLFRSRNVVVAMLAILGAMSCIFVLGAMIPNYLVDFLKLKPVQMGFVMSALGFGGFLGELMIPGASDYIGRRAASVISFVASACALVVFGRLGAEPWALFALLFIVSFFCLGLLALLTGPVATEAVSATLVASAIGIVSGVGEIFGGGVAPAIAGFVAQTRGIEHVLLVALVGLGTGAVVSLFMRETAPRRTGALEEQVAPTA